MKTFHLFLFWVFAAVSMALPRAMPVADTEFDLQSVMDDFLDLADSPELDQLLLVANLYKRDEKTVESLLEYVNKSGIIFDLLDEVADHPARINAISNLTVGLLKKLPPIDLSKLKLPEFKGQTNSSLVNIILKSGLVESLADGLLLDKKFRPVLVNLIYRVVESNKDLILYIVDGVLAKRDLEKRANDYSGTLLEFAENFLSATLDSRIFKDTFADIVNALNDTGIAVYVVQHFLGNDAYINMTAKLTTNIINSHAINITGKPNITGIVGGVLSDPSELMQLASGALSGKTDYKAIFGKYAPAVKSIVNDLEKKGLFEDLNDYIFPSSSASPRATSSKKKDAVQTLGSFGGQKNRVSSSSAASGATVYHNNSLMRALFFIQSFVFGGAMLFF